MQIVVGFRVNSKARFRMPIVELPASPHAPRRSPVKIHYREIGAGPPIVFLHGGWGYGAYPIDRQIDAFATQVRFLIPDRSGHGRSTSFSGPLPTDFHRRAAEETLLLLDALKIERPIFWGHSDGAVIAALIGIRAPQRCQQLILEAFHLYRDKPASRSFFQRFARHPEEVGEKMQQRLAADHGARRWKNVVQRNCRVWLKLAAEVSHPEEDLYQGDLAAMRVPVTFIHGRNDPRTEPGEIERAHKLMTRSTLHFIEEGRHSPHSETAAWEKFNETLAKALGKEKIR
jgi:pimeloyl-ACP methyl ester carboxylesterase